MPETPVFIVGAPRSGTTLLAAMLGSHSRIACGPETQFFNKLAPESRRNAVEDPDWPTRATEAIAALSLSGQPVHELFGLDPDEIRRYLSARAPSVQAMLGALTEGGAARDGKPRWAEKTPNHILHVRELRRLFPGAPVIRIVRDPRDAALSMVRLPWTSDSVIANAYLWNDWHERSAGFFAEDGLTRTLRFEDLVRDPEGELKALCAFIGETFEPCMLDTARAGAAVGSPGEPWKRQVSGPLDASRCHAWKNHLTTSIQRTLDTVCLPGLRAFGYDVETPPAHTVLPAFPLDRASIEQNEALIAAAAADGIRLVPSAHPERDDTLVALPSVGAAELRRLRRWANLALRVGLLCRRRLGGGRNHYLASAMQPADGGLGAIHARLIRGLSVPYGPGRRS